MTDLNLIIAVAVAATLGLLVGLLLGDPSARRRTPPPLSPPAPPAQPGWSPPPGPPQPQWDARRVTSLALAGAESAATSTPTVPAMPPARQAVSPPAAVLDPDAHHYGRHHKPGPAAIETTQVIAAYTPRTMEHTP